jgi:two-component system, chemotaxis family, sensor kinase CheA
MQKNPMPHSVPFWQRIQTKLLLLALGGILIAVLSTGYILTHRASHLLVETIHMNQMVAAKALGQQMGEYYHGLAFSMRLMAGTEPFVHFCIDGISLQLKSSELAFSFRPDGRLAFVEMESYKELATDRLSPELLDRSLDEITTYNAFSQPFYGKKIKWKSGLPYYTLAVLVRGIEKRGLLVADVSFEDLTRRIADLQLPEGAAAFVVSSQGHILAHSNRANVVQQFKGVLSASGYMDAPSKYSQLPAIQELIAGRTGKLTYEWEDEHYIASFVYLPHLHLGVVVEQPRSAIAKKLTGVVLFGFAVTIVALLIAASVVVVFTRRLMGPVKVLTHHSIRIAEGELHTQVPIMHASDELGVLAQNFEWMRQKVQRYTMDLEEIVQEKLQQIRDILDHMDQGLFTITPDGVINPEHSRNANSILQVEDVSEHTIAQLFHLSVEDQNRFTQWLELLKLAHHKTRWNKLVRLSPLQELELPGRGEGEVRFIQVEYQKIVDKENQLIKIMVLVRDHTARRKMEKSMEKERIRHDNEVKSILGITNNPPEMIAEFLLDSQQRLDEIEKNLKRIDHGLQTQRRLYPNMDYEIDPLVIADIARDLHTIKGNAGTYGFSFLSLEAHESEEYLEQLNEASLVRRSDLVGHLNGKLHSMCEALDDIKKTVRKLTSGQDDAMLRIPKGKIKQVEELARRVLEQAEVQNVELLARECTTLHYKPVRYLAVKYADLVKRVGMRLQKKVEFVVRSLCGDLHPDALLRVDEAIVHILRNCVDHGIESEQERDMLGKGNGRIEVLVQNMEENMQEIIIRDDGRGIHFSRVLKIAVGKRLIHPDDIPMLSEEQQMQLIFCEGVSTAEGLSEISGRGIGMKAVKECVTQAGGTIQVKTEKGSGTTFTIRLPQLQPLSKGVLGSEKLPF